jgi:hypothetical protein
VDDQVPSKKQNENSFQMPFSAVKINNENCNEDDNSEYKHNDSDNNAATKDKDKDVKIETTTTTTTTKDKDEHSNKEKAKADKKATKKIMKEMSICKIILEEMEVIYRLLFHDNLCHINVPFFALKSRFTKIHGHFYYL